MSKEEIYTRRKNTFGVFGNETKMKQKAKPTKSRFFSRDFFPLIFEHDFNMAVYDI